MPAYEYRVESIPTESLQETLDVLGAEEWELKHVQRVKQDMLVVKEGQSIERAGVVPTDYHILILMRVKA